MESNLLETSKTNEGEQVQISDLTSYKPKCTQQSCTTSNRSLTKEQKEKLENDVYLVTDFKQLKFEKEAKKNWDLFYKRNSTHFFKDRHWTKREFQELCSLQTTEEPFTIFEAGCGVGNFMFPLLEDDHDKNLFVYACDFSIRAVNFVKQHSLYDPTRCHAFQCDLTADNLCENIPLNSVDVVTLVFVLSAIHPEKMKAVLNNISCVLKPGGCLLLRDYGLYDHAMLRFAPGHKLADNFYVRQDGTRAYYFSIEKLQNLMDQSNYDTLNITYIQRETINRKEGLKVPRIFIQAKCKKKS